eukprot:CAMPEP_0176217196 /NCGR_PEP_ID=MMETSP0121_2-20121125/17574_1 /TAXON_ID=160619 /ORGANISM="Kryptoperidinium foliaceum, Strain CCMP 1326" /LENGTH=223 /DNA_ID=CAMNT_0017556331 /DNA_START=27 /DNA_END=699 /DNA_ORIENTATION=-
MPPPPPLAQPLVVASPGAQSETLADAPAAACRKASALERAAWLAEVSTGFGDEAHSSEDFSVISGLDEVPFQEVRELTDPVAPEDGSLDDAAWRRAGEWWPEGDDAGASSLTPSSLLEASGRSASGVPNAAAPSVRRKRPHDGASSAEAHEAKPLDSVDAPTESTNTLWSLHHELGVHSTSVTRRYYFQLRGNDLFWYIFVGGSRYLEVAMARHMPRVHPCAA